jgi:hypothetical protein
MIAHDLMMCKMRATQRYSEGATAHICLTGHSVWGLMVNILRSQALNMVFLRVLFFAHFCFISFIDVSGVIHFCRFHIYADDLQIYHSSSVADLQRCNEEVKTDLKRIYDWTGSNGLKLNPKKRQVVMCHSLSCLLVRTRWKWFRR